MRGIFLKVLGLGATLFFSVPIVQAAPPERSAYFTKISDEILPEKPLRGYGSLAGHFTEYVTPSGGRSSVMTIQSTTPALAAVLLAKYNSDLRETGGIIESNLTCGSLTVPIAVTRDQGAIIAFRQDAMVTIAAADDPMDLGKLPGVSALGQGGTWDFKGGNVPVYLDVYDQHGFSVAYFGWNGPADQAETFDYRKDFAFATKFHLVLHHQADVNRSDTAEGVVDWPRFEANVDNARNLGIPSYIGLWGKIAPLWLANRYPEQMAVQMPDYVGSIYGSGYDHSSFGPAPAWSSREAENALLSTLAPVVRKYCHYPNVTEFMEPHEEIEHDTPAIMTDYGPSADAAYQAFLKSRYPTAGAVDQQWYAGAGVIRNWTDVHVPEVASFIGWNSRAFDLKGLWRTAQDSSLSDGNFSNWRNIGLDDSHWESILAPGDDHALFRPRTRAPGVFRRTFELPALELARLRSAGQGKIYLYVWDMEHAPFKTLDAALNGAVVGHFENPSYTASWCSFEVSSNLTAGTNLLALHLPYGEICYKVYLSPTAPRCYPDLGPGEDARWRDFQDFVTWTRADSVRRGMEMIRREDPNRFIRLPSPYGELNVEKALAEDFGGQFHDTGLLSGAWNDELPSLMRSSGLPCTLEPGNGTTNLPELKTYLGRWATEGLNGVDYFPWLRDFQSSPDITEWFDGAQPLFHLFGKYHGRRAAVAVLKGEESVHLMGFPWDKFSNDLAWGNRGGGLDILGSVPGPRDMILDSDFACGNADKYRVIIDDNTLIMDDELIARIGKWVRAGGIFITYGHSGQHSPLAANAWPISRLTGYRVTGRTGGLGYRAVPGQTVLTDPAWSTHDFLGRPHDVANGHGLFLEKVAPECRDVLAWDGGRGVALGVRPLGRGYVVADACCTKPDVWPDLLRWGGAPVTSLSANSCRVARFASNNGLDEVLALWGEKITRDGSVALTIGGCPDPTMRDVVTGEAITGVLTAKDSLTFSNLAMAPLETRAFLIPRHAIATAPLEWLNLQRDWWQGTRQPAPAPAAPIYPNILDLTLGGAFSPVPENVSNLTPWVATDTDDHSWPRMDLGIWSADYPETKRAVFRQHFTVPNKWENGRTWLWLNSWDSISLRPPFKVTAYLDGKLIWKSGRGIYDSMCADISAQLQPGSHLVALTMAGSTTMNGVLGNLWVEHLPVPALTQSLAGKWGSGITIPGLVRLAGARKSFVPFPEGREMTVIFFADGGALASGLFINGHWLARDGIVRGDHFRINLTPFIRWGAENEIELRPLHTNPTRVSNIEIRYYNTHSL